MIKVLILSRYGNKGASSRYRSLQYIPHFSKNNIHCTVQALFDDQYLSNRYENDGHAFLESIKAIGARLLTMLGVAKYDVVIIEYEVVPYFPAIFEKFLKIVNVPYLVDYDDAIFHRYDQHENKYVRNILKNKIATVMKYSSQVIAGNQYLSNYADAAGASKISIVPTVIDLQRYREKNYSKHDLFSIVWIGSPSTTKYLDPILPAIEEACKNGMAQLVLIGAEDRGWNRDYVVSKKWSEATEIEEICKCHVGIMPLLDDLWSRGKCGLKLIQYMGCALPVVASPVGVNDEIVIDGENGYLAKNTADWIRYLTTLRDSRSTRERMGENGRERVAEKYDLAKTSNAYISIISNLANQGPIS